MSISGQTKKSAGDQILFTFTVYAADNIAHCALNRCVLVYTNIMLPTNASLT